VCHAEGGTDFAFPFFKVAVPLGAAYIVLVIFVTVGTCNAVNLADGLDGLAVGCTAMVALTFAGLAYVVGNVNFARYLLIPYVHGGAECTIYCAGMVGAGLGFLWFNCHPAQVFMGDTGALPLGGGLGVVSVIIKQEIVLVIAGGVFVAEALSVLLQILVFRTTGKRLFRCAPLHHHFQFKGWDETKVTVRFWILGAILGLAALATLKLR
jgi:phospho-N-acetylmuramoyl-pentapeptide-transferase